MKQHSTNYFNTLITIAEDSRSDQGIAPPTKADKISIANYQFNILQQQPFQFTSDDVIFDIFALRNDILEEDYSAEREKFYAKGQPCLRTSPLCKLYGWGIYYNAEGKIKLVDVSSEEYEQLVNDESVKKVPAMKSKK